MNQENKDEVVYLYLDDIIPNRFQPREIFDERALKELAVSIKEHGVIQPIIVRNVNGKYEIIAGERRYKASALAGLTKIPAIIRDLDDKESSKVALLENLQRKNLNPIEEARTYQKILELDQMTQEDLAKTMGKSQSAVANKIRLLSLPDEVQDALLKEQISERHARTLLNIPDAKKQKEMVKKIISEKMTVRQLEQIIKETYPKPESEKVEDVVNVNNQAMQIPNTPITASTTDFVNNNPLLPTTDLPEDTSNYGKVVIAPPDGEEQTAPRFINYGEIDKDENEDNGDGGLNFAANPSVPTNIDDLKSNAIDINSSQSTNSNQSSNATLDSLLNIGAPTNFNNNSEKSPQQQEYKFITPAEEIVKSDALETQNEKPEDYFKTPDLVAVDLPSEIQSKPVESIPLSAFANATNKEERVTFNSDSIKTPSIDSYEQSNNFTPPLATATDINSILFSNPEVKEEPKVKESYTVQQSVDMLRNLVKDLNSHGVKADIEEMNFAKSYQVIIKLDKTEEQ